MGGDVESVGRMAVGEIAVAVCVREEVGDPGEREHRTEQGHRVELDGVGKTRHGEAPDERVVQHVHLVGARIDVIGRELELES